MSEDKKERTVPEIQAEYQNLCVKAGHLQYSIKTLKDDLANLNVVLRDLNIEAATAKAKESSAKKDEGVSNG